jgi:hypothetical protein
MYRHEILNYIYVYIGMDGEVKKICDYQKDNARCIAVVDMVSMYICYNEWKIAFVYVCFMFCQIFTYRFTYTATCI